MPARSIETQIDIEAPVRRVWEVLVDWPAYPRWNPWMQHLEGELEVGARLDVRVKLDARTMRFRPRVIALEDGRTYRWLGHLLVPGVFDGEHAFALEALDDGNTRFFHFESFGGVLAGLTLRLVGEATRAGFEVMNRALKERCESSPASVPSSA
jgi:hypothetical protein